jgi:hypothetical protein
MDHIEDRLYGDSESPSFVENESKTISRLVEDSDNEVDSRAVHGRLHNLACVAIEAGVEVSSETDGEADAYDANDDSIVTDGAHLADEINAKLKTLISENKKLISENEKTKSENRNLLSKLQVLQA